MSSLLEASALQWSSSKRSSANRDEPFELDLMEVIQAALGAASASLQGWRRNVRPRVEQDSDAPSLGRQQQEQQQQQRENQEAPAGPSSTLDGAQGVAQLLADGFTQVFDRSALAAPGGLFPRDHLFRTLVSSGVIQYERVFFKAISPVPPSPSPSPASAQDDARPAADATPVPLSVLVGAYQLGQNGCGHAGITHGGLTAALCDETLGELLYVAKHKGVMSFKYVVTASLELSYKKPWSPSAAPVYVTASISEVQGRKIWVEAVVADAPATAQLASSGAGSGGSGADPQAPAACTVYATARALFLEPRAEGSSSAALQRAAEGRPDRLGAGMA